MSDRTPYQRGNRDGLLSFAARCDERAEQWRAEARRTDPADNAHHPVALNAARRLHAPALARMEAWTHAAAMARQAAEALPDDPTTRRDAADEEV